MPPSEAPVLALDVDGVLLDYLTGFGTWLEGSGRTLGCRPNEVAHWSMLDLLPSVDEAGMLALIGEFSITEGFGRLPAYEGALEAVAELRRLVPGLRVVAITSAGHEPETERLRRLNVAEFAFDEVTVLPLGASKRDHLARLPKGSVFVDDLFKNIATAEEVGVLGVLIRRPYNLSNEHPRAFAQLSDAAAAIAVLLAPVPAEV